MFRLRRPRGWRVVLRRRLGGRASLAGGRLRLRVERLLGPAPARALLAVALAFLR
jgi:hypothetical protein